MLWRLLLVNFRSPECFGFPNTVNVCNLLPYYKWNLYVYDFGVPVFNSKKSYIYVWPETEGSRRSQEISFFLIKHLTGHGNNAKHIVMYCDSCRGQTLNIKVVLSLIKFLQTESGSTFSPRDWYDIIFGCRKTNKYFFT